MLWLLGDAGRPDAGMWCECLGRMKGYDMHKVGYLLIGAMLLTGCSRESMPDPSPTAVVSVLQTPTAVPPTATAVRTATATPIQTTVPEPADKTATATDYSDVGCDAAIEDTPRLASVVEQLGYAFMPTLLPPGFNLKGVSSSHNTINQIYQNAEQSIIVAYPVEFSLQETPAMQLIGIQRPRDAINELRLGEQTAYIMAGGWSDATILAGPGISPNEAEWDYEKSLALFFSCRTDDEDVAIAIQALPSPAEWISEGELVGIAQSLRRISP